MNNPHPTHRRPPDIGPRLTWPWLVVAALVIAGLTWAALS